VPETSTDQRHNFNLVIQTLDEASAKQEAQRCLQCDLLCNICTTVCPNRANISYSLDPIEYSVQQAVRSGNDTRLEELEKVSITQPFQIINIGDFCNECGNCTTFCPTSGAPYQVKPKFYLTSESFASEQNGYMFMDGTLIARVDGKLECLNRHADHLIYETPDIRARMNLKTLYVAEATIRSDTNSPIDLQHAARMAILYTALKELPIFA
jgi:putative selenate reductase